jgi:1-deoxy-D-xylulose-5-phosphate synthase
MEKDSRIVIITAAMAEGNSLESIAAKYRPRFFDVGICEEHAVTMAAGLASRGFIPVVAVYSTFLQRAFDQIIHDVALQDLPVVFAMDRSGIVGEDGKTHQGTFDLAYMRLIPNMIVSAPKDENELQRLIVTAIGAGHPMSIRYPRGDGYGVTLDPIIVSLPVGKGEVLKKGADLALVGIGATVYPCLEAAEMLGRRGISAAVINARYAKPLDADLINETALETGKIVTVEENTLAGGFGSAVLEAINAGPACGSRVRCIGIDDTFVEHGSPQLLRSIYKLDADGIAGQVLAFFPELASIPADRSAKSKLL